MGVDINYSPFFSSAPRGYDISDILRKSLTLGWPGRIENCIST